MKHERRFLIGALVMVALAVALALIAAGAQGALAQTSVIYVDSDATGGSNGTSWVDAYLQLYYALAVAESGDQIWVAEGTYKPKTAWYIGRYASFEMKNSVQIYGGFDPTVGDDTWEERDWEDNLTILSGDIGIAGDPTDNCYHVFYHPAGTVGTRAVLDGFTITAGNADGASPHDSGGGMFNDGSSPSLSNIILAGNWADREGGGMSNINGSSPVLANVTFADNASGYNGGGMYNYSSSPTLSECAFSGNLADWGGGMFNANYSSPTLTECIFLDNSAFSAGGGVYNGLYSAPTLSNCTFVYNSAGDFGGGGMFNDGTSPTLTNCTFEGNSADGGGGMSNWYASPTLTDCTFTGNSAGWGGGMYNWHSSPTLSDCTLAENQADYDGGGMYNAESSPTLSYCAFTHNHAAEKGGGMHNNDSSPTLSNVTFASNSADLGGGIYNQESSPTLSRCTFSGNSAGDGGGMFNVYGSSPMLDNCTFEENSADTGGGMTNNVASSPTLTNCTFWRNSAGSYGGGMYNLDSSPVVTNCTFAENQVGWDGAGMHNDNGSSPVLTNCILWGNSPDQIYDDASSSPVVSYSDIEGGYSGQQNIRADPLFVDPNNGDFHLGTGSPCIDEGNNAAPSLPTYDFEGDHRILDGDDDGEGIVDMGVDEAPGEYIPMPLDVEIDITPNTPNNTIRLSSQVKVKVAILTTSSFDTADVNPLTVVFAGANQAGYEVQDVDGDGDDDLLLEFYPADMVDLTLESRTATLTGETVDLRQFQGTDRVRVRE